MSEEAAREGMARPTVAFKAKVGDVVEFPGVPGTNTTNIGIIRKIGPDGVSIVMRDIVDYAWKGGYWKLCDPETLTALWRMGWKVEDQMRELGIPTPSQMALERQMEEIRRRLVRSMALAEDKAVERLVPDPESPTGGHRATDAFMRSRGFVWDDISRAWRKYVHDVPGSPTTPRHSDTTIQPLTPEPGDEQVTT